MINPRLKELAEEFNYPLEQVLHFHFLMEMKEECPELEQYLLSGERSVFPYELFTEYQINFCKLDIDTGELTLQNPLYGTKDSADTWSTFKKLLIERGMNSRGHQNKSLGRSIFSKDNSEKKILNRLIEEYNLDLERAADVVVNYYLENDYPLNLDNYLNSENFPIDYETY